MINYIITSLLVVLSGLFSGLNLGLLSIDTAELQRKIRLGDKDAIKVLSIRKNGNLLLCSLLLGNVAVNAAISILLADVTSGLMGGVLSTVLIVIFGEILPQSFVSRYALKVGAVTYPITKLLMYLLYPLSYPMSLVLDKIFGQELPKFWSKAELRQIIADHEDSAHSRVDEDEEKIILGALTLSSKTVDSVMTPRNVVFALPIEAKLDEKTLLTIKKKHFTRVPVYEGSVENIVGVLFVKDLIGLRISNGIKEVGDIMSRSKYYTMHGSERLDNVFDMFVENHIHMAVVDDSDNNFIGIVTLEDVLEEILQEQIYDEMETKVDLRELSKAKKRRGKFR